MKKLFDGIISCIVAFALSACVLFYYDYLQQQTSSAKVQIADALKKLSTLGVEVGYDNLSVSKTPSQIIFGADNVAFITADNQLISSKALLKIGANNNFIFDFENLKSGDDYSAAGAQVVKNAENIVVALKDVMIKDIKFNSVTIEAKQHGSKFLINQLVIESPELSVVAQGECVFYNAGNYGCTFNTSSKGTMEFLDKTEVLEIFTSRGVYVAKLILGTQTSERFIAPIEVNEKAFLIKDILMTPEK